MTDVKTVPVPLRPMMRLIDAVSKTINAKASVRLVNSKSNRTRLEAAIALLEETRDELDRALIEHGRETR